MGKIAFIFPGQGSQYVGMAKDFYETYPVSKKIFEQASKSAGFCVEQLCFEENEEIHNTKYTQVCLLTASHAILKAVEEAGMKADMTAGLSLGEYNALLAAGVMDLETGVKVVRERGIYMAEAVPSGTGAMTAVLSRKPIPLKEICEKTKGKVVVANYNCPGQQVISGEREAVLSQTETLMESGAVRLIPLKVSGPFHSPLLKGAGEKLGSLLEPLAFQNPEISFISNVTAREVENPEEMKKLLSEQVASSVLWQQSVEYMIDWGVDTFVEIGPGKTLSGFVRKINRSVKVYNVEKVEDLERLVKEIGDGNHVTK